MLRLVLNAKAKQTCHASYLTIFHYFHAQFEEDKALSMVVPVDLKASST